MNTHAKAILLLTGVLVMFGPLGYSGGDAGITGWRNDGGGRHPEADVPIEWSEDKHIVWKTALGDWSNATPILVGERLFMCSEPTTLLCVDAKDGKILWQRDNHYFDTLAPEEAAIARDNLGKAEQLKKQLGPARDDLIKLNDALDSSSEKAQITKQIKTQEDKVKTLEEKIAALEAYSAPKTHVGNGYSTPTPTSDGKYVYVLFGTGTVGCYDLQGNRQWLRFIEAPEHGWGSSASPVLVGDLLVVHVNNVFALDKRTGSTIWQGESKPKWGSPVRARIADVDIVITASGDIFRGADGVVLARGVSSLEYATPVVDGNKVYFIENGGKAIRLPNEAKEGMKPETLWETAPKNDRYYASAVLHDGLIYAVERGGHYSVIDAATGKVLFEQQLELGGGTSYPSITLAGNSLLISSDNGTTHVLKPGPACNVIAKNSISGFRSSVLICGPRMYIRALTHLYCIGK